MGAVTAAPATPFTVVLIVFPLTVLLTAFTAVVVSDIPLTDEVSILPVEERMLVLMMATGVPAIPFTLVLKVFAVEILPTVLTAMVVSDTPFTDEVIILPDEDRTLVFITGTVAGLTQLALPAPSLANM